MARTSTRVLFIGNSFIARNDLPGLVVSLAATAGRPVAPTSITAGGAGAAFGSGSGSRRNRPLRIVLYETWARQSDPPSQAALSAAVAAIGAELGLEIAPAGQAWARVLADPDPPVLHDRDGSHPTLAGSFLAAAVLALAIFPADLDRIAVPDDNGLASADATRLLAAARTVMRAGVTQQAPDNSRRLRD